MASESVVLGVPAIYAATTGRGYTDEQETKYGMVKNIRKLDWASISQAIDELLKWPTTHWQQARNNLLANTIDVPEFVANCIEHPPPSQSQDRPGG
jgi:predicted glycosyltransferase